MCSDYCVGQFRLENIFFITECDMDRAELDNSYVEVKISFES